MYHKWIKLISRFKFIHLILREAFSILVSKLLIGIMFTTTMSEDTMLRKKYSVSVLLLLLSLFCSCSKEDYYLFNDDFWTDYALEQRSLMTKTSPEPPIQTLSYPTVTQISNSTVVIDQMNAAWSRMKNSCSNTGRKEYGFWIYYNHTESKFWCGDIVEGPLQGYSTNTAASVHLGPCENNLQVCGFFHTHTSLEMAPRGLTRKTGPSQTDTDFANGQKIPGLLYDYSAQIIRSGDSRNAQHQLYTFGPNQRTFY